MKVEIKIYSSITIIVLLLLTQSVCRSQNISSNIISASDTTNRSVKSNSKKIIDDSDTNSPKDYSTDNYFSSLAFKNNTLNEYQHLSNKNSFEPIPLSQDAQNKMSQKNVTKFQMMDGTYWRDESEIDYGRLFATFGAIAAVDLIAYQYASEVWYREETTGFHTLNFNNDMKKWQYMDKIGHFTDAFFVSDLTSKLYRWSGMSGNSSVGYGARSGWLWT